MTSLLRQLPRFLRSRNKRRSGFLYRACRRISAGTPADRIGCFQSRRHRVFGPALHDFKRALYTADGLETALPSDCYGLREKVQQ